MRGRKRVKKGSCTPVSGGNNRVDQSRGAVRSGRWNVWHDKVGLACAARQQRVIRSKQRVERGLVWRLVLR